MIGRARPHDGVTQGMGIYLSPIWGNIQPQYRDEFGYIITPTKSPALGAVTSGQRWLLDNEVFAGKFNMTKWTRFLTRYSDYSATCIGVVVPDVLRKIADGTVTGDWQATVTQFHEYAPIVRGYGYSVAFVSQDGLPIAAAPWDDFDVLFIGGSDHHKLTESWPLIEEAKRREKWVHVGRVNSAERIELFWMADSWDGTSLAIAPSLTSQRKFIQAARSATAKVNGQQRSLLDALYMPLSYGNSVGEPVGNDVRS